MEADIDRSIPGRGFRLRWACGALACGLLAGTVWPVVAQSPGQEIDALRARIAEQQDRLDAQARELSAQREFLAEQRRRLEALARTVAAAPATATATDTATATATSTATATADTVGGAVHGRFDGMKVTLGGALRTTVTTTSARMQPDATPFLVLPPVPGVREGTTKIDARLSSLLVGVEGAQLGDFRLGGSIFAYLFDGNLFSGDYGFYPGFAYVDATSDDWRFAAGLQMDVFSPRIPTMVDRMSAFAGSGNPGNSFKPQLRVERYAGLGGGSRVTLQAALADALPSNIQPPSLASTENTGVPNLEARLAWSAGVPRGDGSWVPWPRWEVGVSGATGRFRTFDTGGSFEPFETRLGGVAVEGGLRVGQRLGFQGELYAGRALGPYLGAVFQTVGATRSAVSSKGGWGEAAWWWTPSLHSHAGFGLDRVDAADLAGMGVTSNRTAFVNLFWDPSRRTTLAMEATWRRTVYAAGADADGYAMMLSSELRF